MIRRTAILALMMLLPVAAIPQEELKRKQEELQSLRDQIREYEQRIGEQQRNEAATLELLDSYDNKGTLLRRLISRLRKQEEELQETIVLTRRALENLETQLAFLKDHYARYVVSVYKAGPMNDVELLLAARSINQFSIRNEYLKRFTTQRKADALKITTKQEEIEDAQARAQQALTDQRRLIAEKGAEEDRLAMLAEDRRDVLQQIRKDKKSLQREIERKTRAAREMEDMIARLIEQDRVRRQQAKPGVVPEVPGAGFAARKGRLRWPVGQGSIVSRFGLQRHPTLKTVTQNTGIDIAVKAGTPVVSVAEGEVARIWWLPSYGNLLILNHANGFRTVYTHLAEIRVTEGQRVGEGDVIGESGESLDGPRLHFELWKDKEKQNPEEWLTSR